MTHIKEKTRTDDKIILLFKCTLRESPAYYLRYVGPHSLRYFATGETRLREPEKNNWRRARCFSVIIAQCGVAAAPVWLWDTQTQVLNDMIRDSSCYSDSIEWYDRRLTSVLQIVLKDAWMIWSETYICFTDSIERCSHRLVSIKHPVLKY